METNENQPSSEVSKETHEESGLLDSATISQEEDENQTNPQAAEIDHKEAIEEEDDEPLERPDWYPENFWNSETSEPEIEKLSKSWMDLRKQISQGSHKAPKDGKYNTEVFGSIPDDDPVKSHVMSWAKEYGISQGAFDDLVGKVVGMQGEQVQYEQQSLEAEKKALGPNADQIIKNTIDWANGLVRKGVWGEDDFEEFKVMGGTAKGIRAITKLREAFEGTKIPITSQPVDGLPSKEELYQMVGSKEYQDNPAYRNKVERMFQQVFG